MVTVLTSHKADVNEGLKNSLRAMMLWQLRRGIDYFNWWTGSTEHHWIWFKSPPPHPPTPHRDTSDTIHQCIGHHQTPELSGAFNIHLGFYIKQMLYSVPPPSLASTFQCPPIRPCKIPIWKQERSGFLRLFCKENDQPSSTYEGLVTPISDTT